MTLIRISHLASAFGYSRDCAATPYANRKTMHNNMKNMRSATYNTIWK